MTRRIHALLAASALALAACSGTTTTIVTAVPDSSLTIPERLADLPMADVAVDGAPWLVAVAQTSSTRRAGLMFVTDLGALDGMLFIFPVTTTSTFWMRNTPMPLDIAFFAADGSLVDVLQMEPCPPDTPDDDCPSYAAAGPYRFALEAPQGDLIDLPGNATLTLPS